MYALIALGYTMVYGVLNLINFAHGDVMMIGAMVGITILKLLQSFAPDLPGIVKLGIAIVGAIPVCILVNVIIERVAYRRLRNAPRLAPLITAIGVSILLPTCAIGAGLAAVAGVMWGANYSSAQFAMGFVPGLKAFSAAVLGGIGNIYGAMVGGILLGLIESLGAGYIGDLTGNFLGSQYQDIFAFVVLIIVLTLRPSGIMGERVADRA
jgi:branched-chain amino acid transport system permease protein